MDENCQKWLDIFVDFDDSIVRDKVKTLKNSTEQACNDWGDNLTADHLVSCALKLLSDYEPSYVPSLLNDAMVALVTRMKESTLECVHRIINGAHTSADDKKKLSIQIMMFLYLLNLDGIVRYHDCIVEEAPSQLGGFLLVQQKK